MDIVAILIFVVFFGSVFVGIPIVYSLALGALVPALFVDISMIAIVQKFFVGVDLFAFMAIPLFILCGRLLEKSGVSQRLCDFVNALVGWMPGGVAIVTFVTCMFFGAISGSATATVLAIGSIMVPIMIKENYNEKFALAVIAIAGILGSIIPPSIPMVVYGMNAGVDIGSVFVGGIVPGVMLTAMFSVYAYYYGKKHVTKRTSFVLKNIPRTFVKAVWGLMMPFIILGGIYGGYFTPTEAAAIASVYGILVGFFIYRELNLKKFYECLNESVVSSSMIMFIVAAAAAYGFIMTRQQIPNQIASIIMSITDSYLGFMFLAVAMFLILGSFMETVAAILISTPMLLPIVTRLNIDPISFGVIMVVSLAIGFVTPPLGLNLYVAAGLRNRSVDYVVNKHLLVLIMIAVLLVVIIVLMPTIITWLPEMMTRKI